MAVEAAGLPSTSKWAVELPPQAAKDSDFGGCRNIEDTYIRGTQIGEGTYGEVYLATSKKTKEKVALKKIRMDNEKEGFPITAIREIKLLKMLDHENVITLKEIVRSQAHVVNNMKGSIYMVFDYMDHDLTGLMERRSYKMDVTHIKCYMKQLLRGLQYCHKKKILHRDLKASNLLIDNNGILKIADFGLARTKDDTMQKGRLTNRVITLWYRPPELILGSTEYGPEIDIWSVGCIFAELLTGQPLFPGKDESDQLDKICKIMGTPTEATMPGLKQLQHSHMLELRYKENRLLKHLQSKKILDQRALNLLSKLLEMDPKKRITAEQAVVHDYFFHDPLPAQPSELPKYAASHELDMKKLRQDAKNKHAPGGGHHQAKRARHGGEAVAARLQDAAAHHRSGQAYEARPTSQRFQPAARADAWETRSAYDHGPSSSGRGHDGRPHLRAIPGSIYPPAAMPATYPGGGHPGFGNYPGGAFAQGPVPGFDSSGYSIAMQPPTQPYRSVLPQQPEMGEQPSWAKQKR